MQVTLGTPYLKDDMSLLCTSRKCSLCSVLSGVLYQLPPSQVTLSDNIAELWKGISNALFSS